jgi:O-glycosyl hydrolase
MRRLAMLVSVILVLGLAVAPRAATAATPVITVDGQSSGRTFDGIGGLSAGASSALLMDYPPQQRAQILDYLFKPDYGASLQILKVEIGGDTNSTDGDEPSHERTAGQIDCNRGYEWQLMEQAKARNPGIKFYGLEWGTPAWVGAGTSTPWTGQNITYLLDWLGCARQHGLSISYLGGWNEKGFNAAWYEKLRSALDSDGYSGIQIAADDSFSWSVASAMATDPQFNAAVGVVTNHDPCTGIGTSQPACPSTATAQSLGKPLWNSEQGAQVYNTDAGKLAQELNLGYIDGKMTGLIVWSLIWSAYSSLPLQGTGLMLANTPWSGNYTVDGTMIWAMAHTAQFTEPGWRYLDSGSERLAGGGSVVTLRAPGTGDWSSIAETAGATAPQPVTYQVQGGLSAGTVHVWATNLNSANPGDWFRHVADVRPQNGSFGLTLQPGYIYSLTTTTGQHKGTAQPTAARPWRLPYTENFNEYPAGVTPRMFSDVGGGFDTAPCAGRPGMCLQQEVTAQPVSWTTIDDYPLTVVGDPASWNNYQVSVDAMLQQPGYVELDGRNPPAQGRSQGFFSSPPGYHFRIDNQGNWTLYKQDVAASKTTLASGTASFGVGTWHRLGLRMRGDEITAILDGRPLATVLDPTYQVGQVGLQVSLWDRAQFDNLAVQALPAAGQGPQLGAVRPDPVELPAAGDSAQLSSTVTNPGNLPATATGAKLQPPAGWTATTVTAPPGELAGGQSAPLAWQLTAPASAAPGLYQAAMTVTYTEGGLRWIANASVPVDLGIVPHGQMSATATSSQPGYQPANAIDDDTGTFWHTEFSPVKAVPPQSITLDLGGTYNVTGLTYLPGQDGILHGTITAYNVYASTDGTAFTKVSSGTWADDASQKTATFTAAGVHYIRLEGVQADNSNVSADEINILGSPG